MVRIIWWLFPLLSLLPHVESRALSWLFRLLLLLPPVVAYIEVPGLDYEAFVEQGDLNIGVIFDARMRSLDKLCDGAYRPVGLQWSESAVFAINEINARQDLLPNVTLGFVIADTCGRDVTSLARATYFLGDSPGCATDTNTTDAATCSSHATTCGLRPHHAVVGVVGPSTSRQAVMVASLLSIFRVPQLSTFASSDELSDKSRFRYFTRLVPPDALQSRAIISVVEYFDWSYISLLFTEGSYGENGGRAVERTAKQRGICVAFSRRIDSGATLHDVREVVDKLVEHRKARAVVLFLGFEHYEMLFQAISEAGQAGWFSFLASDSLVSALELSHLQAARGSMFIGFPIGKVPGFREHYAALSLRTSSNPWVRQHWVYTYGCVWDPSNDTCSQHATLDLQRDPISWDLSSNVDGIRAFASALHSLIRNECPEAVGNRSALRHCASGPQVLKYLKMVDINGTAGRIQFNEQGDLQGKYWIQMIQQTSSGSWDLPVIGEWDNVYETVSLDSSMLDFSQHTDLINDQRGFASIQSVCSLPCQPRHYYRRLEVSCCWECHVCRDNEMIARNSTGCEVCPEFTWPDAVTGTWCDPIQPSVLRIQDPIGIGICCVAFIGIVCFVGVAVVYFRHRQHRLIKATSKELSAIILLGTFMTSSLTFVYVIDPSPAVCFTRDIGFHVSVSLIYAPLLVKTTRIFRIFKTGRSGVRRPKFISNRSQYFMLGILQTLQLVVLVACTVTFPTQSGLHMPIPTKPYVEKTCTKNVLGFLLPLAVNIFWIVLCAVFGFLTRKLPDNLKESWYIFVCVATTLFMWLIFLPTYFTAFYAYYQAALMSLCLVLNTYVTLGALFAPRVYALYFMKEEDMKFSTVTSTSTTASRVEPCVVSAHA